MAGFTINLDEIQVLTHDTLTNKAFSQRVLRFLEGQETTLDYAISEWKSSTVGAGIGSKQLDSLQIYILRSIQKVKLHIRILAREKGWEDKLRTMVDKHKGLAKMLSLNERDEHILQEYHLEVNEAKKILGALETNYARMKSGLTPATRKNFEELYGKVRHLVDVLLLLLTKTVEFLNREHVEIRRLGFV